MRLKFTNNCVGTPRGDVRHLRGMIDDARDITRATFLKHVDRGDLRELEESLAYADHPSRGLTMAGDWHVSYHRSKWNGRRAYYFRHSAIEFYFVDWN